VVGGIEFGQQRRIILRAVQSGKRKDIDHVIEVLENALHPDIGHALIPLLENISNAEKLAASARAMKSRPVVAVSLAQVMDLLAQDPDPAVKALYIYAAGEIQGLLQSEALGRFQQDPDEMVREAAQWSVRRLEHREIFPEPQTGLADKIICLTNNTVFERVKIRELLPIARECRFVSYPAGQIIFQENQPAGGVYFLCQGKLEIACSTIADMETVEKHLSSTRLAGEMPWIDSHHQLYTLRAASDCIVLEMAGRNFMQMLADFPQVVVNLCKNYSQQIRVYQQIVSNIPAVPE
jgi:hypothetical protein